MEILIVIIVVVTTTYHHFVCGSVLCLFSRIKWHQNSTAGIGISVIGVGGDPSDMEISSGILAFFWRTWQVAYRIINQHMISSEMCIQYHAKFEIVSMCKVYYMTFWRPSLCSSVFVQKRDRTKQLQSHFFMPHAFMDTSHNVHVWNITYSSKSLWAPTKFKHTCFRSHRTYKGDKF